MRKKLSLLVLGLLLCTVSASATIALSTTVSNSALTPAVTSLSTGAFSLTAGNLVVVGVRQDTDSTAPTGVTDTAGNTYTFVVSASMDTSDRLGIYYAKNAVGNASNIVTVTWAASHAYIFIIAHQYSGADTISPLDVSASGTVNPPSTASSVTSGSFTPTASGEVAVAFSTLNNNTVTFIADSNYILRATDSNGQGASEDRLNAPQLAQTASMSGVSPASWEIVVATFKPSGGGGGTGFGGASGLGGNAGVGD